ncbi:MAG TPA: LuxR C-terminal-related transcriptional regulator [Acidimicrobiales bacterium]|nr:LuxR C-terminal-related transcriptional regulator [Acidimicrobiales bacterium]
MTFLVADRDPVEPAVAAFASAIDAVAGAVDRRRSVGHHHEGGDPASSLRIALHTGECGGDDGSGHPSPALRRCARLRDIAAGGQTLLSAVTASLVADALPRGMSLRDLGLHRLRDLSSPERVFELRHRESDDEPPPLRSLDAFPNNLPLQLTTFVGRQAELEAVETLLTAERLVTLTGPGGCGKTRLALQAAADQVDRWPDGVWWAELGAVADPHLVPEVVASAAGVLVDPVAGPLRSLSLQLRDRRLLVCLDNCEHVLGVAGEVVETLLRTCPEVSVLATSREPLGVPGEVLWRVPSLPEDEARWLFLERADLVRPRISLGATDDAVVRTLCSRLEGIPLAIELAAGWLPALTPAQIEAGLDDRLALLVRGPRRAVPRHQTLAASIGWSYDLLDEPDRVVLRRLAVFPGAFDLEAARSVAAGTVVRRDEVLDALGRLVDKSLVMAEVRRGEARYRLLETIREYAEDRLGDAGEVAVTRDRHLDHYLALATAAEPELDRDKDGWRLLLEAEHDNLRAALEWGLTAADAERGRRLAALLPWLWHLHGNGHEGIEFLQRAIARERHDRSSLQARLLAGVALVADTANPLDLEFDAAQRALEIATEQGDERLRGLCLLLSAVGRFYGDFDAAWETTLHALAAAEPLGDAFVADGAHALQGIILHLRDRHDVARPVLESAVRGLIGRGDRGIAATVMGFRADGAAYTGDLGLARRLAEEAVRTAAPLGDYHRVGTTLSGLATVHGLAGAPLVGLDLMEPFVRLVEGAGHVVFVPGMPRVLGMLHLWSGDLEEAVRWLGREAGAADPGANTYLAAQALPPLGAALRYQGQRQEAAAVLERAVELATSLGMPRVEADAVEQQAHLAATDDPDRAVALHHHALAVRVAHGLRTFYTDSLDALAALALRAGRPSCAARLLGASDRARHAMGYPRRPVDRPAHDALVADLRADMDAAALEDARREGARTSLEAAVAYVRRTRGTRRRPSTGWHSLTPSELEVVQLVGEGLTNPEIGGRLFMGRGTVKTHLSHVYAKVGVANRTELAALAAVHRPNRSCRSLEG